MKKSPLQLVNEKYGGRSGLVDQIMPLLETKDDDIRSRLMGTSNRKLLRIHETGNQVQSKFGSRKNLVEKVIELHYLKGKADDGFLKRINEASLKRLLDIYRQAGGK